MSTVDLLRTHAPQAPDELRERVLALRPPHQRQQRRRRVHLRPVLVLAVALALAIAAAVVHGFRTSSPQPKAVATVTTAEVGSAGAATQSQRAPKTFATPSASPNRVQDTDASIRVRV